MFWRILRRILRRNVTYHLLIPLLVGLGIDILITYLTGKLHNWNQFKHHLISIERAGLLGGILVAYFLVMYFVVKEETSVQIDLGDLKVLEKNLSKARSYFAVNTINLREWFGPAAQEYLSAIEKYHKKDNLFRHERVLLFFRHKDYVDLITPYLDYHYAKSLVQMHVNYNIPLSFLQRKEIVNILRQLKPEERKALGCYQRWIAWCPSLILRIPFWRLRRRIPELGCALLELSSGGTSVLRISKHGENMRIKKIATKDLGAYEKLIGEIKKRVYVQEPEQLDPDHDFIARFFNVTESKD